jgi:hypothetical protein
MAFVGLTPQTLNPTFAKGLDQQYNTAPVLNLAGIAVDLSAWVSLTAKLVPPTPSPTGADAAFGTVTAASTGVVSLKSGASDFASSEPGTARLIISGKPTSGDDAQILCTGTITINAA